MSDGRDQGVPTYWGGAGNGGTGGDRGIYLLPPEHGRAINCNPSDHGLVFGGGEEAGNLYFQAMVGAYRPGYHGDQGGSGSRGGGGGYEGGDRSWRSRESRVGAYNGERIIW